MRISDWSSDVCSSDRLIITRARSMGYNNKRRIASDLPADIDLKELAAKVRCIGSSYHKRNPGDFGLVPPSKPRPDKILCDGAGIFKVSLAQRLLVIGKIGRASCREGVVQ